MGDRTWCLKFGSGTTFSKAGFIYGGGFRKLQKVLNRNNFGNKGSDIGESQKFEMSDLILCTEIWKKV